MAQNEPVAKMLFNKALGANLGENSNERSTVLSCGGIYIPHSKRHRISLYQVLTMPGSEEPVKIFTGAKPKNILYEVLIKESMN
jgi:hypothetical protein